MSVFDRIQQLQSYPCPDSWLRIRTIDMHTGGEPLRVILGGFPDIPGDTVLARRNYVRAHYDHLRKALMHEPRGHADMYGCLLIPPNDEGADFGILFLHNEGYSTMCGHATIAIGRLAVDMGWVNVSEPITTFKMDAPCGRLEVRVEVEDAKVKGVSFYGVPSFLVAENAEVEVPGLGTVPYDLAYGGAFYAYVDSTKLGLDLVPENYARLIQDGMAIKRAVMQNGVAASHPFEEDLSFLYGTIFIGGPVSEGIDSRNVCIFAEGEVDRCPTGSGVSGRMAIHHAKGELQQGQEMTIESITGSVFRGSVHELTSFGPYPAVIPLVKGMAYVTGAQEFLIDPEDPFRDGFFLR